MLIRPSSNDARVIGYYLAGMVGWLGAAMLAPALFAVVLGEWNAASAFVLTAGIAVLAGRAGTWRWRTSEPLGWSQGMVTVALAWVAASVLGAIPLYLSGHYGGFGDAAFEAMSGLTTTGLSLTQDLDHLPFSVNAWRHGLQVIGGLGFVIAAMSLFTSASTQAGMLYGAGRYHERTVPDPVRSLREMLRYVIAYAGLGVAALTVAAMVGGLGLTRAMYHGTLLTLSAAHTGGFAPTSASIAYYHSVAVEVILMVLMIAAALALPIHAALWRGDRAILVRHLGVRTLGVAAVLLGVLAVGGLARSGTFTDALPLFRKGVFMLVSAQTTTGLTVVPGRLMATDWGLLTPAAFVGAMAVGGTFASTAGGIKTARVGLLVKGMVRDVRRVLMPEAALVVSVYHTERRHVLSDGQVRAAASILLLFLLTSLGAALVPLFAGETFTEAAFDAVAATSNGGLSSGVLRPDAAGATKAALWLAMWTGRLEFMAVFALAGWAAAWVRGRA